MNEQKIKELVYSITFKNKTPIVKSIQLINAPASISQTSLKDSEVVLLLECLAKELLKDDLDFYSCDLVSRKITTQCFMDFTKDAEISLLRIVPFGDPSAFIFSLIEEQSSTLDFQSFISV